MLLSSPDLSSLFIPGPAGFPVGDLAAFAETRGWRWRTTATGSRAKHKRWHAAIFASGPRPRDNWISTGSAASVGPTEADALALALARLLVRGPA
jgi:hypothetical protein